jgi:hypothetical protein
VDQLINQIKGANLNPMNEQTNETILFKFLVSNSQSIYMRHRQPNASKHPAISQKGGQRWA